MAPLKTAARSRRTTSYSWTSDSSAIRQVSQWADIESSSGRSADDMSDKGDPVHRQKCSNYFPNGNHESDLSDVGETDTRRKLQASLQVKTNYDSDSCLTPRSRRTLRRTVSGVTEPWPSVKTPAKPSLDTIYSPTHEILHPMQSLLLEKALSNTAAQTKVVAVRSTKVTPSSVKFDSYTLGPNPESKSVDFDSFKSPTPQPNPLKFDTYVFPESQPTGEDERLEQKRSQVGAPDDRPVDTLSESDNVPETGDPTTPGTPNIVVIIVDAEKKPTFTALDWAINVAVQPGDEIIILGVLKHVSSPMGYKMVANTDPLVGVKKEILQSETKKTTDVFEQKLSDSGRRAECEKKNVKLSVRIAPGARARTVVVRELTALKATYAIFDRKAMRRTRYYGKNLSCHAVRMRSNGRSTKTITMKTQKTPTVKPSSSPTSDTSSTSSLSTTESPSPTFWRRFTHFRSSRNSRNSSPRSSTASQSPDTVVSPSAAVAVDSLDSFMSEMQDFSISLDQSKSFQPGTKPASKLALQSCVIADAYSYKQGMDSHRIKHRPISVTIPPICAT